MSAPTAIAAPADEPSRSLLEASARQLSLPGMPTEQDWEAAEAKTEFCEGEYTGERLFSRAPQVYQGIVNLLGAGVPIRVIARVMGTHCKTVMGVREREQVAIATVKATLSQRLLSLGQLTIEIVRDQLCDLAQSERQIEIKEIKDLMISAGIQFQNGMLLGGQATSRVEIQVSQPEHDDFNALVKDITAEVRTMGSEAETPGPKEGAPAAGSAPALLPPAPGPEATSEGSTDE